jgi:hypothetical protein
VNCTLHLFQPCLSLTTLIISSEQQIFLGHHTEDKCPKQE